MSRRLVSYSDLAEDAPAPAEEVGAEDPAGASTSRKRKAGNGHPRSQKQKQKQQRGSNGVLHWDDPSYTPSKLAGEEEEVESYRLDFHEHEQMGEVGEDRVNDADEEEESDFGDWKDEELEQPSGTYTAWKYDENGRPYDQNHLPQDDGYDEDDYAYSDEGSDDEPTNLCFAIPSVEEFHKTYDAPVAATLSAASRTLTHRPPAEVGGGGRTLSHAEIWGPKALVDAYNAALSQFCSMHSLPLPSLPTSATGSALWNDAPHHSSLLAQQVREDTQQILSVAKPSTTPMAKGKQVVTHVECANVPGNAAWKKAIKTVQATPNHVGPYPEWWAGYHAGLAAASQPQQQAQPQP